MTRIILSLFLFPIFLHSQQPVDSLWRFFRIDGLRFEIPEGEALKVINGYNRECRLEIQSRKSSVIYSPDYQTDSLFLDGRLSLFGQCEGTDVLNPNRSLKRLVVTWDGWTNYTDKTDGLKILESKMHAILGRPAGRDDVFDLPYWITSRGSIELVPGKTIRIEFAIRRRD